MVESQCLLLHDSNNTVMVLDMSSQTSNLPGWPQTDLILIAECVLAQHTRPCHMPHHTPSQFTKLELTFIWTLPTGGPVILCTDISSHT